MYTFDLIDLSVYRKSMQLNCYKRGHIKFTREAFVVIDIKA